ncbi:MAG: hypothetical protein FD137_1134 [Spirochaetes bacterium]|nr:MAG: hypothetical protein FD137_1134 [Spirochaetota bacterium]
MGLSVLSWAARLSFFINKAPKTMTDMKRAPITHKSMLLFAMLIFFLISPHLSLAGHCINQVCFGQ